MEGLYSDISKSGAEQISPITRELPPPIIIKGIMEGSTSEELETVSALDVSESEPLITAYTTSSAPAPIVMEILIPLTEAPSFIVWETRVSELVTSLPFTGRDFFMVFLISKEY